MTQPNQTAIRVLNDATLKPGFVGPFRQAYFSTRVPITYTWFPYTSSRATVGPSYGFFPPFPSGIVTPGQGLLIGPVAPERKFPIAARPRGTMAAPRL